MYKKILITGASGFLGNNLILKLSKERKFIIHGLVNDNTKKIKKYKNVKYIKCDISNFKKLKKNLINLMIL